MQELINTAKNFIDEHYRPECRVGAVLRAKDGRLFTGVSLQGQKINLCSEWSALVQAVMAKAEIEAAVAVYRDKEGNREIFAPCGMCRELYFTYFPDAMIVVGEDEIVRAAELLPHAWEKHR
jgi:cytidine deaminase